MDADQSEIEYIINTQTFESANDLINKRINNNPDDFEYYSHSGFLHEKHNKLHEALELYKIGLEKAPEEYKHQLKLRLCRIYIRLSDYETAINIVEELLSIDSESIPVLTTCVEIYFEQYDFENAYACINKIIKLDPNNFDAYANRAIIREHLITNNIFQPNLIDKCIDDYKKSLDLNPNNANLYTNIAGIYSEYKNNFELAYGYLIKSIKLDPYNQSTFKILGDIYFKYKNDYEKCICFYRISYNLGNRNPILIYRLAYCYSKWKIYNHDIEYLLKKIPELYAFNLNLIIGINVFQDRLNYASRIYGKCFIDTYKYDDIEKEKTPKSLYLFIGESQYMSAPIVNNGIFFMDPEKFINDDPMDAPLINSEIDPDFEYKIIRNNIRIACFSDIEKYKDIYHADKLWEKFSNNYKGVAYKCNFSDNWLKQNNIFAKKIIYYDPNINQELMPFDESPIDAIEKGVFYKNIIYEFECEWRMIICGDYYNTTGEFVKFTDEDIIIDTIYLGKNISYEDELNIVNITKNRNIKVVKCN